MNKLKLSSPIIYKTKYNIATANRLDKRIAKDPSQTKKDKELLIDYPTVYVIDDPLSKNKPRYQVYVGETNDIQRRTLQHLDEDPKYRNDFSDLKNSEYTTMYVIGHEHFNKSMTLDIENRLMQYLSTVPAVKKLNNRRQNDQNEYYDSKEFEPLFEKIWRKLGKLNKDLFPRLEELQTSALFKASPFNKLKKEQLKAKAEIIEKINRALFEYKNKNPSEGKLVLVEGDAGSGKTVLMSNIFYDLVHEDNLAFQNKEEIETSIINAPRPKKLKVTMLVNQQEQLKVYKEIADKLFDKNDNVRVLKPVTFINKTDPNNKDDIVIIDEAHLLLTQRSQSYAKHGTKMIEDILQRAKVVMAVYDPKQFLSTSAVMSPEDMNNLEKKAGKHGIITLKNQLRIEASQTTINWIKKVINKGIIDPIPKDNKYEIKIFDDPQKMEDAIKAKNRVQDNGISRMVATFDWDYSEFKRIPPKGQRYWEVKDHNWYMPWNNEINKRDKYESKHRAHRVVKYSDESWAEKDYTINEIGSTYTVQGFDLNYVGVVLGPSVKYRNGRIIHDPLGSKNRRATQKRNSKQSYAKMLLKNEFNVLMTRGVHGLYIYAVDSQLRKAFERAKTEK